MWKRGASVSLGHHHGHQFSHVCGGAGQHDLVCDSQCPCHGLSSRTIARGTWMWWRTPFGWTNLEHRRRQNFATDACGNVAEASHTVSHRDTTPRCSTSRTTSRWPAMPIGCSTGGAGPRPLFFRRAGCPNASRGARPASSPCWSRPPPRTNGNAATGQFVVNNVDNEAPQFSCLNSSSSL